ncbi:MAG: hypothetical protein Q9227_009523 [Pyrenula ochraceoflavens]
MPDVKRSVKFVTQQEILPDKDSGVEGFPQRKWSVKIVMVGKDGEELPAETFERVVYNLHPSFGNRARQTFKKPPFTISEEGWGEFEYNCILTDLNNKEHSINQDLHFQQPQYENKHQITFKNPRDRLVEILKKSGNIPASLENAAAGTPNGVKRPAGDTDSAKRKKKADRSIDMDRLADNLQKLDENDLLHVVQLVHDYKTEDSYTKNDVERKYL